MLRVALGLPGLAACLIWSAAAVPLRQASRSCGNQAEPNGRHFLVDNSKLNAKTRGLSFRFSKNSQDKDPQAVALWGTEVIGTDQGDGWLKVGSCFLPMMLKDVPTVRSMEHGDAAAMLSQHGAAKTFNEAQLKQAINEAAEVTEAVTAKLKKSQAEMEQLRAQLQRERAEAEQLRQQLTAERLMHQKQMEASEARHKELQKKMSTKSPVDELLSENDGESAEMAQALEDQRAVIVSMNETNHILEVNLRGVSEQNRQLMTALSNSEEERKHMEQRLSDLVGLTGGGGDQVNGRILELEDKLQRQRTDSEATIAELVHHSQKNSVKNTRALKYCETQYMKLEAEHEALKEKLGIASNETLVANSSDAAASSSAASASSVSRGESGNSAASNSSASAESDEGTIMLDSLFAGAKTDSSTNSFGGTTVASGSQTAMSQLSDQRHIAKLEKEVKDVQKRSDDLLMMCSTQVKDIQKKMAKNNHTFQLRFAACERRYTELEDDCANKVAKLSGDKGGNESVNESVADLFLMRQHSGLASEAERELQAMNQNLSQQVAQLNQEKAEVQASADALQEKFERKERDQQKTIDLVDDMQEKFKLSQDDYEQKLTACQQQLAKASSSAAGPAIGAGAAMGLLLSLLLVL